MAFIDAYYGINFRGIDLNQLVRFGYDGAFLDNENISYNGVTYQDVLEVDWYDGFNDYASLFGGRNIDVNGRGDIVGGTVTGYLELVWNGFDYETFFGIEGINVSARKLYAAALTRSTADDQRLMAEILSGNDLFSLSFFDDFANGLKGRDTLQGLGGDDTLNGGLGDDRLFGGGGADRLLGGGDDDRLVGGGGEDTLAGGGGDDHLKGNAGDDALNGKGGDDTLAGGAGDDLLNGGGGDDALYGGGGRDRIIGSNGNDTLKGGGGNDVFVFDANDGTDRILGFQQGRDRLEFRGADDIGELDIEQRGGSTVIEFGATTVIVVGQDADDFTQSDFIF